MSMRVVVVTGLVALLLPAGVRADEAAGLRAEIAALEFLDGLSLDRAAALRLLPLAERGALVRRDLEAERDRLLVRFHSVLVTFREEDLADALTPETTARAGALDHELKEWNNTLADALAPLEREFAGCLAPAGRTKLMPERERSHPLDTLRAQRGSDFEELRDRIARELAKARGDAGTTDRAGERMDRLRIRKLLHGLRDWSDEEYLARRDALLDGLVPGWERSRVTAEIRTIYRKRYGQAGPLAEHWFREDRLALLARRLHLPVPILPPRGYTGYTLPADLDRIRDEIASLKADINLLNLRNGLCLEAEQRHALAHALEPCVRARPDPIEAPADAAAIAALKEIREALVAGEEPSASAVRRARAPQLLRGSGYLRARGREYEEARTEALAKVDALLSPEQKEVLRTYKACLVPPKDLRDPVRAGQAYDPSILENLVDRLRAVPLDGHEEQCLDRILRGIEQTEGRIPDEERACALALMLGVACEAQSLDDVAYVARRNELAGRLAGLRRLDALKDRLLELDGAEKTIESKIAVFLLDPRFLATIEDGARRAMQ